MLIRIRRSKDLLLQFQSFECSSLFASNSCVYCTTRYNKCGRIGTKWLFFFTFIEECCVVIEKNTDKKLANRISYQIWHKRCLKGKFGRGVQICEGGSISAGGFGPGGVHIRCDTVSSSSMFREVRGYGERQLKMIFWEEIPVELRISPLLTSCNVVRM